MSKMEGNIMVNIEKCMQTNSVQSEYEALFSVISPILEGLILSLKRDIVDQLGGYDNLSLEMFTRLYQPGDGDCGICFEYAVHRAIVDGNNDVLNRIETALMKYCNIRGDAPSSILFGAEKSGMLQFVDSVKSYLTDDSLLLTGKKGKPIKLKRHIDGVVSAFKKPIEREKLPSSINGLWKADLFVGQRVCDKWVGTTVKINPAQLEGSRGLRLGIVPSKQGKGDKIYKNETKNLIVCPVPYDQSFMEIFYEGWNIVKQFILAHGEMPQEMYLSSGLDRLVCKELVQRRKFPALGVVEVTRSLGQPHLMSVEKQQVNLSVDTSQDVKVNTIVTPVSKEIF